MQNSENRKIEIPISGRQKPENGSLGDVSISIHPTVEKGKVVISVQPPTNPQSTISHVPCDIVLTIDLSGSMGESAPIPSSESEAANEKTGLSILDLTKHAARTVLESLDENDRLAIVTYSDTATVLQELESMTPENKLKVNKKIEGMRPDDRTNLWHGITTAIKVFNDASACENRIPAILILTDGLPNYLCPRRGYAQALGEMTIRPSLHTFGFGYRIRSGLLKSIAEVGNGNYAFIPDAGMIGTVFVHALANLQSTFASQAALRIRSHLRLRQTMGKVATSWEAKESGGMNELTINLDALQYGQSRDIVCHFSEDQPDGSEDSDEFEIIDEHNVNLAIQVELVLQEPGKGNRTISQSQDLDTAKPLPASIEAYHLSRAWICSFLASLFPAKYEECGGLVDYPSSALAVVDEALQSMPAAKFPQDEACTSLRDDLAGQIRLAISNSEYFQRWGRHFLRSLLNAHEKQLCNSFKDPGPLQYGKNSPLFRTCRDKLDSAFDFIPPPTPSLKNSISYHNYHPLTSMRQYNNPQGWCFAGYCAIRLGDGTEMLVDQVCRGMMVATPVGQRRVEAVIKSDLQDAAMCRIGDLTVTPWHPIYADGKWCFPSSIVQPAVLFPGESLSVFSFVLEEDENSDAHGVYVGGHLAVTWGHGIMAGDDARAHAFFGSYQEVKKSIGEMGEQHDYAISPMPRRCLDTGRICGFEAVPSEGLGTPIHSL